jgi:hypothetical protein
MSEGPGIRVQGSFLAEDTIVKGYTEAMTNIAFGMTVGELVDILQDLEPELQLHALRLFDGQNPVAPGPFDTAILDWTSYPGTNDIYLNRNR